MTVPRFEIVIDELAVPGVPRWRAERVADGVRVALERLVAERGLPPGAPSTMLRVPAVRYELAPGQRLEDAVDDIAASVYAGIDEQASR